MLNGLIKDQNGITMTNIPTDLLRTFVTIKDLGGFTSAGELLGRSQPAISLQIKKLEEILNTKIFLRGSSLELTEDGEYLYEAARQILEINDQIIAKVRGDHVSGKVRLGIPNDFELAFLPKALRNLSRVYPNIIIEVDCEISKVILQRYQKGHYDIALAMERAKPNEDRDARDYRLESLEWVYKDSRLVNGDDDPIPLIAYPQGCVYRSIMEEALQGQKHPFRFMYTSTSLLGIFSAVEEGLGITAMARSVIPENLKHASSTRDLPELERVCIGLYYKERELNVASRHVLDFLRSGLANI
ncbi:LysR family transcriptional regulator [Halomonas sp. JS92-SW72]|nr:LysR family transcriptional regulator [Halomonas sp. JS92-SW72]